MTLCQTRLKSLKNPDESGSSGETKDKENEAKNGQQAIMEMPSNTWKILEEKETKYKYVRENLVIQPGHTRFPKPGFIRHIFTYIQIHLIHTESWKSGHGKLAVVCYDEVSMSKDSTKRIRIQKAISCACR